MLPGSNYAMLGQQSFITSRPSSSFTNVQQPFSPYQGTSSPQAEGQAMPQGSWRLDDKMLGQRLPVRASTHQPLHVPVSYSPGRPSYVGHVAPSARQQTALPSGAVNQQVINRPGAANHRPVANQWVTRPGQQVTRTAGTVNQGTVRPGGNDVTRPILPTPRPLISQADTTASRVSAEHV